MGAVPFDGCATSLAPLNFPILYLDGTEVRPARHAVPRPVGQLELFVPPSPLPAGWPDPELLGHARATRCGSSPAASAVTWPTEATRRASSPA